jgi:hypothetical protein
MVSSGQKRRFPPPWRVERAGSDCFEIRDANGFKVASVNCRDDLQKWSFGHSHLTSDEARRIANAIARLPELLMQRRGFHPRGGGHDRWKPSRPYHVALEDSYIRAHWDEIDALCKLNSIPFNATGEKIRGEGLWCVYEFTWQMDAILFWETFEGRWLRGTEFHYPERPKDLPAMKSLKNWPKFDPRNARG